MSSVDSTLNYVSVGAEITEWFGKVTAVVVSVLLAIVAAVLAVALLVDVYAVIRDSFAGNFAVQDIKAIFALALLILIALELNHSIFQSLGKACGIIQVRTIVLIALLAILRKLIVLDYTQAGVEMVIGLAVSALILCGAYHAVRET